MIVCAAIPHDLDFTADDVPLERAVGGVAVGLVAVVGGKDDLHERQCESFRAGKGLHDHVEIFGKVRFQGVTDHREGIP